MQQTFGIIVALLTLTTQVPAPAEESTKSGPEIGANELRIDLYSPKQPIRIGEPIVLQATLTNVSAKTIVVETNYAFNNVPMSQYVLRAYRDGEKLKDPLQRTNSQTRTFFGSSLPRQLSPQEAIVAEIDLGANFDVSEPGSYKVQLERKAGQLQPIGTSVPCTGKLAGATSCVQVLPGQPTNRQETVRWTRAVSNVISFVVEP